MNVQNDSMVLSAPLTHSDWLWRDRDRIGHGPQSVRYTLDRCKEMGWTKVYWRCFDGGRANYPSKLMASVSEGFDPDNYHAWSHPR